MTRPSGETNEPEPPLLKRTEDFCTCSNQPGGGSKPYFSWRILSGGLLNSHMPSSVAARRVVSMGIPPEAGGRMGRGATRIGRISAVLIRGNPPDPMPPRPLLYF